MGERQAERPVIFIDPQKARDLDRDLALQKLYYRPEGYYRTAEKMQTACNTGKRPIDRVPSRLVSFCLIVSNRGIQIDKFRIPTRLFTNV